MSDCGESDIHCDLPYEHQGECVELTVHEIVGPIENFPVIMGGKTIGEATYIGDGMASISIDDKFAKRFISGSNIHISIATPDNKD